MPLMLMLLLLLRRVVHIMAPPRARLATITRSVRSVTPRQCFPLIKSAVCLNPPNVTSSDSLLMLKHFPGHNHVGEMNTLALFAPQPAGDLIPMPYVLIRRNQVAVSDSVVHLLFRLAACVITAILYSLAWVQPLWKQMKGVNIS